MEFRPRVDIERHPAFIRRDLDRPGDQRIERIGLVEGPRHQRVEQQRLGEDFLAAFQDEGMDGLERVEPRHLDRAALGRIRPDIVEMGEAGAVFEIAEHAQPVAGRNVLGQRGSRDQCRRGEEQQKTVHCGGILRGKARLR